MGALTFRLAGVGGLQLHTGGGADVGWVTYDLFTDEAVEEHRTDLIDGTDVVLCHGELRALIGWQPFECPLCTRYLRTWASALRERSAVCSRADELGQHLTLQNYVV